MHTLRAEGLSKKYDSRFIVRDITVSLSSGEVVGLLGPNGAGKTTTFYMIIGMLKPEKGRILLNNEDISNLPMYQRAEKGVSYLPQEPSIFRRLTVKDNLRSVLEIKGLSSEKIESRVEELLNEFNLRGFSERDSLRLSGGERRRVEIARSVATQPKFILFDEPFAGIDPIAIIELKKLLKYLKGRGHGILLTDHNVRDTLSIVDRAYILTNGEILDEGLPEKLITNPKVKELYLGEGFTL